MNRHRLALESLLDQLEKDLEDTDYYELGEMARAFVETNRAEREAAAFEEWKRRRIARGLPTTYLGDDE